MGHFASSDSLEFSDSDEEYDGMLKQALQVNLDENFDPEQPPTTGEEYLQRVIYERESCKQWLRAPLDTKQYAANQTVHLNSDQLVTIPKTTPLPSRQWQQSQLENFEKLRRFVYYQLLKNPQIKVGVEYFVDEVEFIRILLDEKSVTVKLFTLAKYTQSAIIRMLQIVSKHLLSDINQWQQSCRWTGGWLYGLLALLQIPLAPSSCHSLRQFAKRCIQLRNINGNSATNDNVPFNVYICIVGRYYQQYDLADEYPSN